MIIGIDQHVQVMSIEEIPQQFLHPGDACRASDQHDVVYRPLVNLGVTQRLLHRHQSTAEQVVVQILELGTSDACGEVDAFKQRVNLDVRLKPSTTQCNQPDNE